MENGKLIPMSTGYDFSKESSGQFFKNSNKKSFNFFL
jgi:hypothetical protein